MSKENLLSNNPDEDIEPLSPFGVIDFGITEGELKALTEKFVGITAVTTRKEYDAAQAAVTQLVRARTDVDKRRKALKSESLEFGRLVDSTGKELMAVVEPEEIRIKALVETVKAVKAAEKAERERIEKERLDGILGLMDAITKIPATLQRASSKDVLEARTALEAAEPTEDVYQEHTERAHSTRLAVIEELNELYQGALHDEKLEAQAQKERDEQAAANKIESERLEKERAALAEAQAGIDAENKRKADELAEQQAVIDVERKRVEDEKQAIIDDVEAKKIADKQKAAADLAKKAAAKLAKKLAPDREKLAAYLDAIDALEFPETSDELVNTANAIVGFVEDALRQSRDAL